MPEINETDWAYAAGFVDGEGCIAIVRSFVPNRERFVYSVQVVVANTGRSTLDWMHELWQGWVVSASTAARGSLARDSWTWRAPTGTHAEPFLLGIQPYLKLTRAQSENALEMIGLLRRSRGTLGRNFLPAAWLAEQEALYWKQRELNHRGTQAFVRQAMHSPRKIHRARSQPG